MRSMGSSRGNDKHGREPGGGGGQHYPAEAMGQQRGEPAQQPDEAEGAMTAIRCPSSSSRVCQPRSRPINKPMAKATTTR